MDFELESQLNQIIIEHPEVYFLPSIETHNFIREGNFVPYEINSDCNVLAFHLLYDLSSFLYP